MPSKLINPAQSYSADSRSYMQVPVCNLLVWTMGACRPIKSLVCNLFMVDAPSNDMQLRHQDRTRLYGQHAYDDDDA